MDVYTQLQSYIWPSLTHILTMTHTHTHLNGEYTKMFLIDGCTAMVWYEM